MLIDMYNELPKQHNVDTLTDLAAKNLGLRVRFEPGEELPQVRSKPFFDLLLEQGAKGPDLALHLTDASRCRLRFEIGDRPGLGARGGGRTGRPRGRLARR